MAEAAPRGPPGSYPGAPELYEAGEVEPHSSKNTCEARLAVSEGQAVRRNKRTVSAGTRQRGKVRAGGLQGQGPPPPTHPSSPQRACPLSQHFPVDHHRLGCAQLLGQGAQEPPSGSGGWLRVHSLPGGAEASSPVASCEPSPVLDSGSPLAAQGPPQVEKPWIRHGLLTCAWPGWAAGPGGGPGRAGPSRRRCTPASGPPGYCRDGRAAGRTHPGSRLALGRSSEPSHRWTLRAVP